MTSAACVFRALGMAAVGAAAAWGTGAGGVGAAEGGTVPAIFPLLLPQDASGRSYAGFLTVKGREFLFRIALPPDPSRPMSESMMEMGAEMQAVLRGAEAVVLQRLAGSPDLPAFLIELKEMMERALSGPGGDKSAAVADPGGYDAVGGSGAGAPGGEALQNYDMYLRLVHELGEIGWGRLVSLDATLTQLQLRLTDARGREHTVAIYLPAGFPASPPQCSCALPAAVALVWPAGGRGSLRTVLEQYAEALNLYQDLWDILDDIDQHTWVIEPEHPTRAATIRRLAIGNHCSIQIDVDPRAPHAVPGLSFLGADNIIGPLRVNLSTRVPLWDLKQALRANLENVLQIRFPSPQTSKMEEFSAECGICYAYRLDGLAPERVCENKKCGRPFHRLCLYESLRALPDTRQTFDTLFGACPYCSEPITVKMAQKR